MMRNICWIIKAIQACAANKSFALIGLRLSVSQHIDTFTKPVHRGLVTSKILD